MAATRSIITRTVGDADKAEKKGDNVRTLQRLLESAGTSVPGGADGAWGRHTHRNEVYEATTREENGSSCIKTPLERFTAGKKSLYYLFKHP